MQTIIGVKFKNTSKIYYFDPKDLDIHYNDHVIVETVRGVEYGTVVLAPMQLADEKVPMPLKDVIRIATELDDAREAENRFKEKEAYKICKKKIAERGLEMKLIRAEYTFDNSKVLFYFTADGRIDFRDLVKELASIFRTRIELRQIGVRDETKILGGMGICGRPLCCHTYLSDFAPVSIKMAKEQNLSLNPAKISGCCGRLMCCLKNEADTYIYLNKGLPSKGDQMTTPDGRYGEVQSVDILRQRVKCIVDIGNDEKEMQEYHVSEITFIPHSKKSKGQGAQNQGNQKNQGQPDQSYQNQKGQGQFGHGSQGQKNQGQFDQGYQGQKDQGNQNQKNQKQFGQGNPNQKNQGQFGQGNPNQKNQGQFGQGNPNQKNQGQFDQGNQKSQGQSGQGDMNQRQTGQGEPNQNRRNSGNQNQKNQGSPYQNQYNQSKPEKRGRRDYFAEDSDFPKDFDIETRPADGEWSDEPFSDDFGSSDGYSENRGSASKPKRRRKRNHPRKKPADEG